MSYDVLETYEVEGFYTRYDKFYVKCKPVKTTWLQRLFGKSCLYFELVFSHWVEKHTLYNNVELKKSNQVWASENKDTLALPVSSWYLYSPSPPPPSPPPPTPPPLPSPSPPPPSLPPLLAESSQPPWASPEPWLPAWPPPWRP